MEKEADWKECYVNSLVQNPKTDRSLIMPTDKKPFMLYKYVSLSVNGNAELDKIKIETFKNNQLFLSSPLEFNDPYDCELNIDISEQLLVIAKSMVENEVRKYSVNREAKRHYEKERKKLEKDMEIDLVKLKIELENDWEKLKKEIAVCCLSEYRNSMLMWSHYANSYKGFCIGYDFSEMIELYKENILPVVYTDELTSIQKYLHIKNKYIAGIYATVSKSTVWKYENEWRIIGTLCKTQQSKLIGTPKPKELYLGSKIDKDARTNLIEIAKTNNIKDIFDIEFNKKEFKVLFEPIN